MEKLNWRREMAEHHAEGTTSQKDKIEGRKKCQQDHLMSTELRVRSWVQHPSKCSGKTSRDTNDIQSSFPPQKQIPVLWQHLGLSCSQNGSLGLDRGTHKPAYPFRERKQIVLSFPDLFDMAHSLRGCGVSVTLDVCSRNLTDGFWKIQKTTRFGKLKPTFCYHEWKYGIVSQKITSSYRAYAQYMGSGAGHN